MNRQLLHPVTTVFSAAVQVPRKKYVAYKEQQRQKQYHACAVSDGMGLVIPCDQVLARKRHHVKLMWLASLLVALLTTAANPPVGLLLLFGVGVGTLVRGALTHRGSWLLAGSVLSSVTTALLLTVGLHLVRTDLSVSAFLLTIAVGLLGIIPLSRTYTCNTQWWPVGPGLMLALAGLATMI